MKKNRNAVTKNSAIDFDAGPKSHVAVIVGKVGSGRAFVDGADADDENYAGATLRKVHH